VPGGGGGGSVGVSTGGLGGISPSSVANVSSCPSELKFSLSQDTRILPNSVKAVSKTIFFILQKLIIKHFAAIWGGLRDKAVNRLFGPANNFWEV